MILPRYCMYLKELPIDVRADFITFLFRTGLFERYKLHGEDMLYLYGRGWAVHRKFFKLFLNNDRL